MKRAVEERDRGERPDSDILDDTTASGEPCATCCEMDAGPRAAGGGSATALPSEPLATPATTARRSQRMMKIADDELSVRRRGV